MEGARRGLAFALLAASGFAALGCQVAWTHQAAVWLGHDGAAVLAVVCAFFAGLALGSGALGARIAASTRPGLWYAGCELVIGAWALMLAAFFPPVAEALMRITGPSASPLRQWSVAFAGTALLLLPATAAMGATLPAIERAVARWAEEPATIARLYAANTAGAVVGVLAMSFWLVPAYGIRWGGIACACVSLVAAGAAWMAFGRRPAALVAHRSIPRPLLGMLAATGLLGIGYEVLAVRVLRQHAENTVYTFAMLLAVYLLGTALGGAAYAHWRRAVRDDAHVQARLLRALGLAILAGLLALAGAGHVRDAVRSMAGPSFASALVAEAAMALAVFLPACLLMGALFSHLAAAAKASHGALGSAIAANTLGAALAPIVLGVLVLPLAGVRLALVALAIAYIALAFDRRRPGPTLAALAVALALAVLAPSLAIVDVPHGGRIVRYEEGPAATVSVVEDDAGVRRLHIDNRQQEGSSATLYADARQALMPLALHPAPRRALFLGLGSGVTAAAAAADPVLRVDAVELLPEVIRASAAFAAVVPAGTARLHVETADARRYVRAASASYDVIVSDNFHPARSGSGALYTVEHFHAVRGRLARGGLFCQWLPLHQMDLATLRSVVRAFLAAFPDARAVLATHSLETPVVGLVGGLGERRWDIAALDPRIASLPDPPGALGLDGLALLGSFIAGSEALARFAGDAPINTDDRLVVAFRAPIATYAPDMPPRDRLLALVQGVSIDPALLVADVVAAGRLRAYTAARDLYLTAGRDVEPRGDARQMLARVRTPLLAALERSPDFRPAYDPLLRLALAVSRDDPRQARAVLTDLHRVQPARPEAAAALHAIPSPLLDPR